MRRTLIPCFAVILPICLFAAIVAISTYAGGQPDYTFICPACQGRPLSDVCSCPTSDEFYLWSVCYQLDWMAIVLSGAIFALSFSTLALMTGRWLTYFRANRQSREFRSKVGAALYENRITDAINISALYPASPLAAVVQAGLENSSGGPDYSIKPSMQARQRAIVAQTEELRRNLWALAALGWTVPLVGFFIFIVGIINMLNGMDCAEGTAISAVAGSVADALWATLFSTLVAVPIIWSHKYFSAKAESFILEMDRLSLAILDRFTHPQPGIRASHYITQELNACPTRRMTD